jgi:amphi-Trp domain-containing protein
VVAKKKEFEHESLQDRQSLCEYLHTVTRGVEEGRLTVSGRDGEITLEPRGLIRFELQASLKPDRGKLTLRLSWKPGSVEQEKPSDELRIRSGDT